METNWLHPRLVELAEAREKLERDFPGVDIDAIHRKLKNSPASRAPRQAGSTADVKRRKGVPSTGCVKAGSIPAGGA